VETLLETEEFLSIQVYDGYKGNTSMNTLLFTYVLFVTLLLLATLFASSIKVFFTDDELDEMGVCIGHFDIETEGMSV
jgi:hypothetical protein